MARRNKQGVPCSNALWCNEIDVPEAGKPIQPTILAQDNQLNVEHQAKKLQLSLLKS